MRPWSWPKTCRSSTWGGKGSASVPTPDRFWYTGRRTPPRAQDVIVTRIGDTAFGIAAVWMYQLFGTVSITELNGMGFLMRRG